MSKINRTKIEDAKKVAESLIKKESARNKMLEFLTKSISYAEQINSKNWNLNLDKNGRFIRFNVGRVYCIEISKNKVFILCLRENLEKISREDIDIKFVGHKSKKRIESYDLNKVPDSLASVPSSIECHFSHDEIEKILPFLSNSHDEFIKSAILRTTIRPLMEKAHSIGFINYLDKLKSFSNSNLIQESAYEEIHFKEQKAAQKMEKNVLRKEAEKAKKKPEKTLVSVTRFIRNQYVVEYAKIVANGICQDCLKPAPFINKFDGKPFLETHHIVPLSKGGLDTIVNTIALCPNCHRKRHYG